MAFYQNVSFWVVFVAVFIISLILGGFIAAIFKGCPAFFALLIGSIVAAFLAAFAIDWLLRGAVASQVEQVRPTRLTR
jgi:hypothetical protein